MRKQNFPRKPVSTLTPLSGILASATKGLSQRDHLWEELILKSWPKVMGENFYKRVVIEKLTKGTLYLSVAEDSWIKPFQEKTKIIINKINHLLRENVVRKVIITGPK